MPKTKILVVDDHLVVIEGIKSAVLDYSEFEVVGEATNGREAVEMAIALKPDIVIMDISMTDQNGLDATLHLKKTDPGIRIVIFTMHTDKNYVIELFKAGVTGYVLKEDPMVDLISAIYANRSGASYFNGISSGYLLAHINELEEKTETKYGLETLSLREREVFQLLAEGSSIKQISKQLFISAKTVETHKYSIMRKLQVNTIGDLIKIAIRKKIISI